MVTKWPNSVLMLLEIPSNKQFFQNHFSTHFKVQTLEQTLAQTSKISMKIGFPTGLGSIRHSFDHI